MTAQRLTKLMLNNFLLIKYISTSSHSFYIKPNRDTEGRPKQLPSVSATSDLSEVEILKERDFKSDFFDIGRRCAFGVVALW